MQTQMSRDPFTTGCSTLAARILKLSVTLRAEIWAQGRLTHLPIAGLHRRQIKRWRLHWAVRLDTNGPWAALQCSGVGACAGTSRSDRTGQTAVRCERSTTDDDLHPRRRACRPEVQGRGRCDGRRCGPVGIKLTHAARGTRLGSSARGARPWSRSKLITITGWPAGCLNPRIAGAVLPSSSGFVRV